MQSKLVAFLRSDEGATSIEYALIAAFIAIVIVTAVTNVGQDVAGVFNTVESNF
jgi:pilus assembly protein Flp/PilA